MSPPGYTH